MKTLLLFGFFIAAGLLTSCEEGGAQDPVVVNKNIANNKNGYLSGKHEQKPDATLLDQSPLDIIYFPIDFPKLKSQRIVTGLPKLRVIYSRPRLHDRKIFGFLQKYGQPWRIGANEATEIELFVDATVQGKKIAKGRYILYAVPEENQWELVFNKELYTWGLEFDEKMDVLRVPVPVEVMSEPSEIMTMYFEEIIGKANLVIEWERVRARVEFKF